MSLGKIGKLTNVFNAFKQSPFSNKSDMISSLAAFGNINKAASYLNKVNSDGAISNTASKMLLYKAYAASGITKEEHNVQRILPPNHMKSLLLNIN